jgi:hypothetical protein
MNPSHILHAQEYFHTFRDAQKGDPSFSLKTLDNILYKMR